MKKVVVVGVTGGIAAYKAVEVVSALIKKDVDVHVIMTKNACEFVTPLTFETMSHNRVSVDTFDRNYEFDVEHVSLAKLADCFVIVPATANVIAKVAHGIADDMLTTTFLAASCPKLICPAMNTGMLNNPITQKNIQICKDEGMMFVDSETGLLACLDVGSGKLANVNEIVESILVAAEKDKFLKGKKVFVSAGATVEKIDAVRTISNPSSGKMGIAIAKIAKRFGAEVTLAYHSNEFIPKSLDHVYEFESSEDLAKITLDNFDDMDIVVMAAAVSDYTPKVKYDYKVKKTDGDLNIELERTQDILKECGKRKKDQIIVGFAMETDNLVENATSKLKSKNADLIVANNLFTEGAGFNTDTNKVTFITSDGVSELELMSKEDVAREIFLSIKE